MSAETQPGPLVAPVKRTTIVVADLARSLAFYQNLLGLSIFFDGEIGNPGASQVTATVCEDLRMVVLVSGDEATGMIGLMEIRDPTPALEPTAWDRSLKTGETILVIPTDNMKRVHLALEAAQATIVTPPVRVEVPGRPEIHEMMVRDPDGVVINLTQRGPLR